MAIQGTIVQLFSFVSTLRGRNIARVQSLPGRRTDVDELFSSVSESDYSAAAVPASYIVISVKRVVMRQQTCITGHVDSNWHNALSSSLAHTGRTSHDRDQ